MSSPLHGQIPGVHGVQIVRVGNQTTDSGVQVALTCRRGGQGTHAPCGGQATRACGGQVVRARVQAATSTPPRLRPAAPREGWRRR
jgi:hypothetical protein